VLAKFKLIIALVGLVCIALSSAVVPSLAVTPEVAKACRALTAKAYPPREPGNPAAGSAKGSGRDQTSYFNKCVANGGKVEGEASKP